MEFSASHRAMAKLVKEDAGGSAPSSKKKKNGLATAQLEAVVWHHAYGAKIQNQPSRLFSRGLDWLIVDCIVHVRRRSSISQNDQSSEAYFIVINPPACFYL